MGKKHVRKQYSQTKRCLWNSHSVGFCKDMSCLMLFNSYIYSVCRFPHYFHCEKSIKLRGTNIVFEYRTGFRILQKIRWIWTKEVKNSVSKILLGYILIAGCRDYKKSQADHESNHHTVLYGRHCTVMHEAFVTLKKHSFHNWV